MSFTIPLADSPATSAKEARRDAWLSLLEPLEIPAVAGRLVVVAPHPDDETLGAGALIHDLGDLGWDLQVVVVSDGSASHPEVNDLAAVRETEVMRACDRLGVVRPPVLLGHPDGQVERCGDVLVEELRGLFHGCDVVVAPKRGDGHADHEATAVAVDAALSSSEGSAPVLWRYAVWAWERSDPDAGELRGAFLHRGSADAVRATTSALGEHRSQTTAVYGSVIVPPSMQRRAAQGCEVFWC